MNELIHVNELWANLFYVGSPFKEVHNMQGESLKQILDRIPRAPAVTLEDYNKLHAQFETALSIMADAERKNRILVDEIEKLRKELGV